MRKTPSRYLAIATLLIVWADPLAAGIDPKDVVEASRIIEQISKLSNEITAVTPTAVLVAPTPRPDNTDAAPGKPYLKEPSKFQGRYYAIMTPAALPLWWDHGNPIGDKGPFSIGNYKVMCAVAAEYDTIVITPTFLVHLAELKSSGRKIGAFSGYAKGASTGAKPKLSVMGGSTVMQMLYAKNSIGGDGQNLNLNEDTVIGEFGADIENLAQSDNTNDGTRASLQGLAQASGNLGFFAAAGPTRSKQTLAVLTDPATFRVHVLSALRGVNQVYIDSLRTGSK